MIAIAAAFISSATRAQSLGLDSPYQDFVASRANPRLLPGHEFTFSSYGIPGDVESLRDFVAMMKEKNLGNGFDPGPVSQASMQPIFEYLATVGWPVIMYPGYADMQVIDGDARIDDAGERALSVLDRAGVFNATQLGEWGYYFHNLSHNKRFWQDIYGDRYDQRSSSLKPRGLAGYDRMPASRREAYDVLRNYYLSRNRAMRGRNMSVTGHSHYEAYVAEWGSPLIGLELGENIGFTQSKIAFARGAARRWQRPFSIQVSPWFHGACTTKGPLRIEGGDPRNARGLDAGHSLSFYERMWLSSWFAGAAMVTPENSFDAFYETSEAPWPRTSHGEKAAETFRFFQSHERGVPYIPVAIMIDRFAGFNGYQGRPWGILEPTAGDVEIRDLFNEQIWPGADIIHVPPDPENPEQRYLRPTPYGELFDVLLSNADVDVLRIYPVLLLAGDIQFDAELIERLRTALRFGAKVLIHARHAEAISEMLDELRNVGDIEVLDAWTNPATGRPAAVPNDRLQAIANEYAPAHVSGAPVQYQFNRTPSGWVMAILNHEGVVKKPTEPARVDPAAVANVEIDFKGVVRNARLLRSQEPVVPTDGRVVVQVPPGGVEFLSFEISEPSPE